MTKAKATMKKYKNGRERPHFFGFQPPKTYWGRSRPAARSIVPFAFSTATGNAEEKYTSREEERYASR